MKKIKQTNIPGFTLIELVTVIVITAILLFLTIPIYTHALEKQILKKAIVDIEILFTGLKYYKDSSGEYPEWAQKSITFKEINEKLGINFSIKDFSGGWLSGYEETSYYRKDYIMILAYRKPSQSWENGYYLSKVYTSYKTKGGSPTNYDKIILSPIECHSFAPLTGGYNYCDSL